MDNKQKFIDNLESINRKKLKWSVEVIEQAKKDIASNFLEEFTTADIPKLQTVLEYTQSKRTKLEESFVNDNKKDWYMLWDKFQKNLEVLLDLRTEEDITIDDQNPLYSKPNELIAQIWSWLELDNKTQKKYAKFNNGHTHDVFDNEDVDVVLQRINDLPIGINDNEDLAEISKNTRWFLTAVQSIANEDLWEDSKKIIQNSLDLIEKNYVPQIVFSLSARGVEDKIQSTIDKLEPANNQQAPAANTWWKAGTTAGWNKNAPASWNTKKQASTPVQSSINTNPQNTQAVANTNKNEYEESLMTHSWESIKLLKNKWLEKTIKQQDIFGKRVNEFTLHLDDVEIQDSQKKSYTYEVSAWKNERKVVKHDSNILFSIKPSSWHVNIIFPDIKRYGKQLTQEFIDSFPLSISIPVDGDDTKEHISFTIDLPGGITPYSKTKTTVVVPKNTAPANTNPSNTPQVNPNTKPSNTPPTNPNPTPNGPKKTPMKTPNTPFDKEKSYDTIANRFDIRAKLQWHLSTYHKDNAIRLIREHFKNHSDPVVQDAWKKIKDIDSAQQSIFIQTVLEWTWTRSWFKHLKNIWTHKINPADFSKKYKERLLSEKIYANESTLESSLQSQFSWPELSKDATKRANALITQALEQQIKDDNDTLVEQARLFLEELERTYINDTFITEQYEQVLATYPQFDTKLTELSSLRYTKNTINDTFSSRLADHNLTKDMWDELRPEEQEYFTSQLLWQKDGTDPHRKNGATITDISAKKLDDPKAIIDWIQEHIIKEFKAQKITDKDKVWSALTKILMDTLGVRNKSHDVTTINDVIRTETNKKIAPKASEIATQLTQFYMDDSKNIPTPEERIYTNLTSTLKLNDRLEELFNKDLEKVLWDSFDSFMKKDKTLKNEWKNLTLHEKKHFFDHMFIQDGSWLWTNGKQIKWLTKDKILSLQSLKSKFKSHILNDTDVQSIITNDTLSDADKVIAIKDIMYQNLGIDPSNLDEDGKVSGIMKEVMDQKFSKAKKPLWIQFNNYYKQLRKTIHIQDPFNSMYDDLLSQWMDFNGKLNKTYTRHHTSVLRDRFHRFWENHHNDNVKYKWGNLSEREKEFFFTEMILKKLDPRRTGWKHIPEIDQDNNTSLDGFQKAFKEKVSKDFLAYCKTKYADKITKKSDDKIMAELKEKVVDLEADFKAFIETKLDYDFAKPNPAYAIGLLWDMVQNKYGDKDNDLQKQMNLFLQNMDNGNIIMDPQDPNYNSANPNSISDNDLGDSSLLDAKELKAVVADTEMLSEEKALARANEDFKNKYESSAKFGPTRAYLFFFRSHYINKQMKKYMNDSSYSLDTDEETTSAVNRWMLKKSMNLAGADKITEDNNVFNDPAFNADFSRLLNEYCNGTTMTADEFNTQAVALINAEAQNGKAKLDLEALNVSQIGSNLVEIATIEKEQRQLYGELIWAIDRFYSSDDNDADKLREFDGKARELITAFSTKYNKLPDMIKELQPPLDLDKLEFAEKLATHRRSLEKMRMRNVKMKLSMLVNSEALQQPKWYEFLKAKPQDNRWLTTAQHVQIDKLWGRPAFYRWMEQHPYLTALWTTAWLLWWWALWAALSVPWLWVGIWATTLAVLNYFKKKWHYTKEHVKFEKKLLAMTSQERDSFLKKMQKDAEKRPGFLRAIWPTEYDKYGNSLEFTKRIQTIQKTNNNIQKYLGKKERLSANEQSTLRHYLIEWVSALQLQEDIGRNFLQSQTGKQEIEKMFNNLHKTILGWLGRMNPSQDPQQLLQQLQSRISTQAGTTRQRTQYDKNAKDMGSMRTKLWLFAAGKSVGIYLASAWAFGQVAEAWNAVFGSETASSITSFQLTMDPTLQSSLQSHMDSTFGWAVDLSNMTPQQAAEVHNRLSSNGLILQWSDIYQPGVGWSIPGTPAEWLILDPALTWANPWGKTILTDIFGWDTVKFDARQETIKWLDPSDRSQTLRDSFYDLYGSDKIATEKTRAFFDYFGEHIVDAGNQELVSLTTRDPLSQRWAEAIANKMTERWSAPWMLSSSELSTVTDPTEIKNLFDGFASGRYTLSSLPTWRDIQTAQDVLHCKYGGFWYGLRDYIFDYASNAWGWAGSSTSTKVGSLISDVTSDWSSGRNPRRTTLIWAPTVRNDLMKYTWRIPEEQNQQDTDNNTPTS